jgi:hypothetical protein
MATSAFPTSYVTAGGTAAADREASAAACPVCPHGIDDHDAISARFCRATEAATAAGTTPRGCICRG